jgi:hypothetical protein
MAARQLGLTTVTAAWLVYTPYVARTLHMGTKGPRFCSSHQCGVGGTLTLSLLLVVACTNPMWTGGLFAGAAALEAERLLLQSALLLPLSPLLLLLCWRLAGAGLPQQLMLL